jgi:hypothetical protein
VNTRNLETATEQAAKNAKSEADTVAAKHAEEIKALKIQSTEKETELFTKMTEFEKSLGDLKASHTEKVAKITRESEEV